MERIDLWVKGVVGAISGILSILTGLLGIVFTVLLGLMLIDFITGVMAAAVNEGFKSDVGTKGFIKKMYIILLIGAVFMMGHVVQTIFPGLEGAGAIGDVVSGVYCVIEFGSIVENGGKTNAPVPKKLKKWVAVLRNKVGEDEGENKEKQ